MYQLLRITHDGREEEMEENMQLVNTMIGIHNTVRRLIQFSSYLSE